MKNPEDKFESLGADAESIPVFKVDLSLGEDLLPLLHEINKSGVYSNFGPQVQKMEQEFSHFLDLPPDQVVSVGNATLGIQGALVALDQQIWTLPSWTFAATAHAGLMSADSLLFGDIARTSWALNPIQVTEGTGAVVTAPFGAQITIGDEWNHVGALVIDAAASVASFPTFLPEFQRPWAIAVSLHATKILGIGEGGFVAFSSAELARDFRQWTNFGFLGNRKASFPSTNAKMSEVSAAIARVRLAGWSVERDSWLLSRSLAHQAAEELKINPPFAASSLLSPYWIVEFDSHHKKLAAMESLDESHIGYRDWWSEGCHKMPAFDSVSLVGSMEVTDDIASRSLGLPFFRGITEAQVLRVQTAIERAIR